MKKTKALMSAILSAVLLTSTVLPAFAEKVTASDTGASFTTQASSEGDPSTFSWDNATVYFLLTDRFKNGDTSNDNAYGRKKEVAGDSRATFHGGDFAGITQKINEGYFNDLGVNAIWLSAPYEQIHGYIQGGSNYYHYSYHGYYVLDYTETDQAFGTKEEFKTLVDTAHEHGIRIVMDIVMNHAGYCSMYDMNEYGYGALADGWESFYNNPSSNAQEYQSYMLYNESQDLWAKWWGADWIRSGVAGYSEEEGNDLTRCLEGLPDFRTESTASVGIPELLKTKWSKEGTLSDKQSKYGSSNTVTGYISTWLAEWVREYGVDGFRCDTAKHVELSSWKKLKDACVDALREWKQKNPDKKLDDLDFWMTGECWDHNVGKDGYYTEGGFDSMINFDCTGGGILNSGSVGGKYNDYAGAINNDDTFNVLTYMSSHDTTLARGDNFYLCSAFLMLPGGVQIFYGDETAREKVQGVEDDSYKAGHCLRSDMNWDSYDPELLAHWQKVGTFRNNHIAVGAGANTTLTASEGVAFGRTYDKNGISDKVVGVIGAGANSDVTIDVSDIWPDDTALMNYYDEETYDVTDGKVTVNSGEHGTILLEQGEADPVKARVKGESKFDTTQDVAVTLEGVDSAVLTIDGIKKINVKNGDTVTIGDAAYPGDTVVVTLTYNHPTKGEVTKKFSFKKNGNTGGYVPSDNAIVHVYAKDLASPNLYAWTGDGDTAVNLIGAWPGSPLSDKDDDGWYVADLKTTDKFNIIVNAGGEQSGDITGLQGETWAVVSSDYKVTTYKDRKDALKATGVDVPVSDFEALKQICKEIKLLDTAGYSSASYGAAMAKVKEADELIAQGEDKADSAEVSAMYKEVLAAKEALVFGGDDTDTDTTTDTDTVSDTDTETDTDTDDTDTDDTDTESDTDTATDTDSDSDTDTDVLDYEIGDVNMDGKLSLRDAFLIQRRTLGLEKFTATQEKLADYDRDGDITLKDASSVQKVVTSIMVGR